MPVIVRIPTPLQGYTGGAEEVSAATGKISSIIDELDRRYPGIGARICDNGRVRSFMTVSLNDVDIRFLQAEDTPANEGDEVLILPAIAGGAGEAARRMP